MSRVWLLNLDAEVEIEGRGPYPGPHAALRRRPQLRAALGPLIPDGDAVLLDEAERYPGARGFSWSPTPSAARALRAAGAEMVRPLARETLACVMGRGFSAGLGLSIAASRWSRDANEALAHVRSPSPSGRWLVRRAFGFAGKARRAFTTPQPADERFVVSAADEGGVLIEPFVEVTADFGLHGFVDEQRVVLGEPVTNDVGPGGVFRASRRTVASDLSVSERAALTTEAERAGQALRAAGYRGPYGIDAFRYMLDARPRFQPRCEINPRYSMAWAIGMADRRLDLG